MAIMSTWIDDLEAASDAVLPPHVREYFAASASRPDIYRAALAEWDAVRFHPRAFAGARSLDLSTTVLGTHVASPILVAPMAQQVAANPAGEQAVAEAVSRRGTLLAVSTNTGIKFETIAAAGAPWWFQVYLFVDRAMTKAHVERAVAAGASALVFTIDLTALHTSMADAEPHHWPDGPGKVRLANLTAAELKQAGIETAQVLPTLDDIGWLHEISGLPVVVKGIVRPDDAVRAVDAGATGVLVSTHGGRRMSQSVTSLAALPGVVAAVGDRVEVYVDSGIRSGLHVLAALALGARAVFVGRPVMWGLASGGVDGVERVLTTLTDELVTALNQSGEAGIHSLSPGLVVMG
jgi:4-hydroxymandelate oxidase